MAEKRTVNEQTMTRCDVCGSPAVVAVTDCREIPCTNPEGWREFEVWRVRRGCQNHPVRSMTVYLDGREMPSEDCVPEKEAKPCQLPSA